MPRLSEMQRAFAEALFDTARQAPGGLTGPQRRRPERRFAVYRNNVHANLIDVLQGRFPVVARLVGPEFFRAMARDFIHAHPPVSPVLMFWGPAFAGFLESYGPAGDLPYLPDTARLEWAWSEAYHAADARPLDAGALAAVAPRDAEGLVLEMHPSLRVVRSLYPILTIWDANQAEGVAPPVDLGEGAEDVLVLRPELRVELRALPPGGAAFIAELARGGTLGSAIAKGGEAASEFSFEGNFAALLRCGAMAGYRLTRPEQAGKARL